MTYGELVKEGCGPKYGGSSQPCGSSGFHPCAPQHVRSLKANPKEKKFQMKTTSMPCRSLWKRLISCVSTDDAHR